MSDPSLFSWIPALASLHPKLVAVSLGLSSIVALRYLLRWNKIRILDSTKTQTPAASGNSLKKGLSGSDAYSDWEPISFEYPVIAHREDKLDDILPLPYRPFRWGAYHITMGLRNLDWADWIEIDNTFPRYHAIRSERIQTRGEKVVRVLPPRPGVQGASFAAKELMYDLAEFLVRRYPAIYSIARHNTQPGDFGWYGEGQICTITIKPLGITYDLDKEDPMTLAALITQDDIAIMIKGADGKYYFQGGAILTPSTWRMFEKLGLPLDEIHITGNVPQYKEKLEMSLDRFFSKLRVEKPVTRCNYFFQVLPPADDPNRSSVDPEELAWSYATRGDEDLDETSEKPGEGDVLQHKETVTVVDSVEQLRLRVERQTVRRLPRSGAIIFTIRTYVTPIVELAIEPGVPGRLASAIRGWSEDVAEYKGQHRYRDAILSYLDEKHDEQIQSGISAEEGRKYPF